MADQYLDTEGLNNFWQSIKNTIPDVDIVNRCIWITHAGEDLSVFEEGNTNVASFSEFVGHTPFISLNNVGLILVSDKLYWTKFNITAINESAEAAYQEFTQDPILIGLNSAGDGISIDGDTISVETPTRGIYTQEEFDALPEEQQNSGFYVISDGGSGSGGGSSDSGGGVPAGFIGMWSGTEIPDGWALCDGTNGTPDLRGRFVLGESASHTIGETGGSEEVTLTVEQMPQHTHTTEIKNSSSIGNTAAVLANGSNSNLGTYFKSSGTGNSQPHPNMPPYYVLAYIMKL